MSYDHNSTGKDDDYKRDIRTDAAPPHPHYHTPHHARRPSRFWIFVLSFLPGLGHIYLGLIRRGLFYIAALALLSFLSVAVIPSFGPLGILTGFAMAALYAVSFFEAFGIRRDIIMGKEVKDTIPNIGPFGKSKNLLFVCVAIVAVSLAFNILAALPGPVWVVAGIVAVCYFYAKSEGRKSGKGKDNQDK